MMPVAQVLYDLSQPVENGMTYFPGDPEPHIAPAEADAPWQVSILSIGSHTGTHIDAASHYHPDGLSIDHYAISRFMLPAVVAPIPDLVDDGQIAPEHLDEFLRGAPPGGAILIQTGWDRFWKTDRYLRHPYLTPAAAERVVASGIGLLGMDTLNPDSTVQDTSHVHDILLGNDVLIVENLTRLDQLQIGAVYILSVLPLNLAHLDGSPVRAVAWPISEGGSLRPVVGT